MFRIPLLTAALGLLIAIGVAAESIHDAAASGDIETVRHLLDRDPALANLPDVTESLPSDRSLLVEPYLIGSASESGNKNIEITVTVEITQGAACILPFTGQPDT